MKVEEPVSRDSKINVGRAILADMIKAFQTYLDERKWRNVRYSVSESLSSLSPSNSSLVLLRSCSLLTWPKSLRPLPWSPPPRSPLFSRPSSRCWTSLVFALPAVTSAFALLLRRCCVSVEMERERRASGMECRATWRRGGLRRTCSRMPRRLASMRM